MIKIYILISIIISFSLNAKVTIVHNINGYSINQHKLTQFKAIAFEYENILKIGDKEELIELYPKNNLIDGEGKTMLPGLHDSHINILQAAKYSTQVDLRAAKSIEQVLQLIKEYHETHPNRKWIEGYGWNQNIWVDKDPKNLPTRWDLDSLKIKKPIWLISEDKTMGWGNTRAMRKGQVFKNKQLTSHQVTLDKSGKPEGIFFNASINLIQRQIHENKTSKLNLRFNEILNKLPAYGITGINDNDISNQAFTIYRGLIKRKKIPIRINTSITSSEKIFLEIIKSGHYHDENQFLHIHSSSYYIDDDFKFHKALLFKPYSDNRSTATIRQSEDYIKKQLIDRSNQNWQVNLNATGDRATHIALNLLHNKAAKTKQLRHRINNAALIGNDDLKRFKQSHITVSIQPNQAIAEFGMTKRLLGKQRSKQVHPWQSLHKNGARIVSGSNFPYSSSNPFYGIHAAVTRQNRNNKPSKTSTGWNPKEKLSVEQALATYTINPAYANHQEFSLGSLETGKLADFILIDQDIFSIKPQDIWKTKVLQTWIAGKKVYDLIEENEIKKQKEKIFKSTLEK